MWAANISVHPNLALAIRALKAAVDLPQSGMVQAAVCCHAARLQLTAAWSSEGFLRIGPCANADLRWCEPPSQHPTIALGYCAQPLLREARLALGRQCHSALLRQMLAVQGTATSGWLEYADVEIASTLA